MSDVIYHPEQRFQCNGLHIAADSFGDKRNPPVLLIMGLATQLVHWDEAFCRKLAAQGYWVIRFDNRDIGRSDYLHSKPTPGLLNMATHHYFKAPINAPYLLDDMANDAVALLDSLNIPAAHIIGVSMGGMIAQIMAIQHPDRVLSLTSIMSSPGDKKLMKPKLKVAFTVLRPRSKSQEQYIKQALAMWKVLHGKHFPFEEERMRNMILTALQRGVSASGIMRQLGAIMVAPDRTPQLQQLDIPSLVVHGDADPLVPVINGIKTAEAIPDSELKIIKGMGHTIPVSIWDELIDSFNAVARKSS
ncbi:alpha/beta hydrolase [Paraneptunicella aestuarii]|nr:alpha/beta hydrolase [Paraneptunicella aestuarii]